MQFPATMATLLKRSDAPLYRIHVGHDYVAFGQQLSRDHCFEMNVVLHAPRIPMSEDELTMYIQRLDCHIGKAWFTASWPQAVAIFGSVLLETATQTETPCIESEPPVWSLLLPRKL